MLPVKELVVPAAFQFTRTHTQSVSNHNTLAFQEGVIIMADFAALGQTLRHTNTHTLTESFPFHFSLLLHPSAYCHPLLSFLVLSLICILYSPSETHTHPEMTDGTTGFRHSTEWECERNEGKRRMFW